MQRERMDILRNSQATLEKKVRTLEAEILRHGDRSASGYRQAAG